MCGGVAALLLASPLLADEAVPGPSHGIEYPQGWQQWGTIAVSQRTDNQTIRVILGNDIAVEAARSGQTRPWPAGAKLGKVVWKAAALEQWPAALGPEQFVHAEFMVKDPARFTDSGGWGWARWVGLEQTPFNQGNGICVDCHTPVKGQDWVFTKPASWP
ncbi:cytochrome P460 family protein [Ferrimonas gelatinilytica]|uniref:Cytochrome P460 family protein n=1 Tax=Ferrimonas gelatinilytica TaxID=1255257 RepID=A0ABP9RZL4_9GAMM